MCNMKTWQERTDILQNTSQWLLLPGVQLGKKGLQQRFFLVQFAKSFETNFLQSSCEQFVLNISYFKTNHR